MQRSPKKSPTQKRQRVLVVDVGGSNIKLSVPGRKKLLKIKSGPDMNPERLLELLSQTKVDTAYDVIAMGLPSPVVNGLAAAEPTNLGEGWVGFDFSRHAPKPIRVVNDAALQALGSWTAGRMLFLGLGTGLGSALVMDGLVMPLELCELRFTRATNIEQAVCKAALKQQGPVKWEKAVYEVLELLKISLLPDTIVVGGGNAKFLTNLPPGVERGQNTMVQRGGKRLWEMLEDAKNKPVFRWKFL